MLASLLTTFFFALSALCGQRSTAQLGAQRANLARQIVALALLALWAHTAGQGLRGPSFAILFVSGVVGFGLGDWGLYEALVRIGPSLTILLCQCLAVPIAAVAEWAWLGTRLTLPEVIASAVILAGVAVAMAPTEGVPRGHRIAGAAFGVLAAAGQGLGAVISRYGLERAAALGFPMDGITAAYQRLWGGLAGLVVLLTLRHFALRWFAPDAEPARPDWRRGGPWVVANAVTGAALGVSCYQWALQSTPSGIVLPVVATTPLVVMGLAFVFERTRPSARALAGSALAVIGVVALIRIRMTP